MLDLPAAMVSPERLINTLPISLFTENGSSGIGNTRADAPAYVGLRSVICTSADVLFVSTLSRSQNQDE